MFVTADGTRTIRVVSYAGSGPAVRGGGPVPVLGRGRAYPPADLAALGIDLAGLTLRSPAQGTVWSQHPETSRNQLRRRSGRW